MKKFIIIDANALIHRAFHALPPLTTKDGVLVNAVYGFTTIFFKMLKDLKPDYIACCFDVSQDTFRKKEYAAYKAKRVKQPQELYDQIGLVKELLAALQVTVYEKEGFEADDVIGTMVELNKVPEIKNIIVTGDLDALQLINDNTEVYTLKKGVSETIIYDKKAVAERFGFGPEKMVDYKALRGDPSDNIPGVKGIGEKTALDLIKTFGGLKEIYQYLDKPQTIDRPRRPVGDKRQLIKEGVASKLIERQQEAILSQKLATIVRDVPIGFNLADCLVQPFDTRAVVKLFQAWNFSSLIAKIPQADKMMYEKQGTLFQKSNNSQQKTKIRTDFFLKEGYQLIDNVAKFNQFLKELAQQKEFVFDTETDGLNPFKNRLLGVSFAWKNGEAWYLPIFNPESSSGQVFQFSIFKLKEIFKDQNIKKIGHNLKFDYEVLDSFSIKVDGLFFDTMIASYLLNPGTRQHNLDNLAFVELGYKMQTIEELSGENDSKKIDLSKINIIEVANYSCEDADITWQLYHNLSEKLDEATIDNVLTKIEIPLIPVLASMEKIGVKLDINFLRKMSSELAARIEDLETKIYQMAGVKFNVASPLQLKEILFEKLKISSAGLGKTKTGISTASGELEKMKGRHKIIDLIIEHRELNKLKNTYLDPLPELVDENKRVHTSFNQTVTATGRLSSSDPNLQNIPIRTELGKKIRRAFVAEKGYQLVAADYSQIELRIIASLAADEKMLEAFRNKRDIHTETAAEIFEVAPNNVTSEQRRQAKAVNFGVIYGLGPRGLAQGTGLSLTEAENFIEKYFEVYAGIKIYIEETIALTKELGYAETLFHRRRYLPEINAQHQQLRAQAERMAINHCVQGTAADLMKIAMININERLNNELAMGEARLLLQIHDELVFEVKEDLVDYVVKVIEEEMTGVYKLKAPIEVGVSYGDNWGECK